MPQAVDDLVLALEQLSGRLLELEHRITALESRTEDRTPNAVQLVATPPERPRAPATWRGFPPVATPSGVIPVVGKAVLGIAGAYLLRALVESSSAPKLPVLFVAIVYACFWMVWAVRAQTTSRFASVTYAITAALILSPMLWESTARFQVLTPASASVVLVFFVVLTIALAWRRDLQLIPWVATVASVVTALALIIESHELVPLTAALLAIGLVTEIAACLGHRLTLRAIPALAADFAVWLMVYILAATETVPEGYRPAAPASIALLCFLLLAIYGGSIGVRSFVVRYRITPFEVAQGVLAFTLASYGAMRATRGSIVLSLGALFLLLAAVGYWGTLSRFTNDAHTRNRRVAATWAAGLLLGGSFLLFPTNLQIPFLSLAAVATTFIYTRTRKLSLGMHASFYLAAGVAVSPLPLYIANALAGEVPSLPDWRGMIVAAAATICYALGSHITEDVRSRRLLWVIPGAIAGFAAAAWMVAAVVHLASSRFALAASSLSVIRTVVNCALALALAFYGSRWKRVELGWLAYAAVAFGTLKLLFEDLRFGNAASLVLSLLFYGLVLILLPRLTRRTAES